MIPGTKPLAYYKDQHGVHPIFGWEKITNPSTGWLASKTDGWTADNFSEGLEVDFSSVAPIGARAVRALAMQQVTPANVYWRKSGDSNISNTPQISGEWSHRLWNAALTMSPIVVWLSSDYKTQFAVSDVNVDFYIAYPVEYLV